MTNHTQTPSVRASIIIPAYEVAHFIARAIESALAQSYPALEVIVVDNASTDDLLVVLEPYRERIRYTRLEPNQQLAGALNHGVSVARGEFITFLDADDYLIDPDKTARQVEILDARPDVGVVHSGWHIVDKDGALIRAMTPWDSISQLDAQAWMLHSPVRMQAMLMRRRALEAVNGLRREYDLVTDADLLLRMAVSGIRFAWYREITAVYVVHSTSYTGMRRLAQMESGLESRRDILARPDLPAQVQTRKDAAFFYYHMWAASQLFQAEMPSEAADYLARGQAYHKGDTLRTLFRSATEIIKQLYADNHDLSDMSSLAQVIRMASDLPENQIYSIDADTMIRWWLDVWWFYVDHYQQAKAVAQLRARVIGQKLTLYQGQTPAQILRLAQAAIKIDSWELRTGGIAAFWEDLLACDCAPDFKGRPLARLYLTFFLSALGQGNKRAALRGLMLALRHALMP